jgi:hypothetical protein
MTIEVVAPTPFGYRVSCATGLALSLRVKEKNRCLHNSISMTPQLHSKLDAKTIVDSTHSRSRPCRMCCGTHTPMLPSIAMHTNSYCKMGLFIVCTEKPAKAFSYSTVSPSPLKRQWTDSS